MKNICVIGAGNIGSRHLQGLKKITSSLLIHVIDPSADALKITQERYNQVKSLNNHKMLFQQDMHNISKNIDLAIIATNSNVRREVLENLLVQSSVKYLLLEKILFQKRKDYTDVAKLLKNRRIKTWVNFSMRTMPLYSDLKNKFKGVIQMIASGSQYGLITNAVHFVDYIAYLTNCYDFKVTTDGLESKLIKSRRKSFSELNGTLNVYFKDGSFGSFSCYPIGNTPFIIELLSENYRCISRENERKAWISQPKDHWQWKEVTTDIPYQSDMTNLVVEDIFNSGSCKLTPYNQAMESHLNLLEPLLKFLNKNLRASYSMYPFT